MAIVKLKKREELKILFAVKMPEIVSELYKEIKNKKIANSKLKEILNIKKDRVINIIELVDSFENIFSVLVIYDNILTEKELLKYDLDIESINFRILDLNFNSKIEMEKIIESIKSIKG
jgi:hypothetical protein